MFRAPFHTHVIGHGRPVFVVATCPGIKMYPKKKNIPQLSSDMGHYHDQGKEKNQVIVETQGCSVLLSREVGDGMGKIYGHRIHSPYNMMVLQSSPDT